MAIKHLTFDNSATIDFASITAAYTTLLALSDDCDLLFVYNTTNAAILLSIPSGANTSKDIRFPASTSMAIDCRTNSKRLAKGNIQVKYAAGAPTSGEVTVTAAR